MSIRKKNESIKYELAEWRAELESLLTSVGIYTLTRGRRSTFLETLMKIVNIIRPILLPSKNTRQDMTGYLPRPQVKRGCCKIPLCKSFTYFKCIKCNCYMCS